MFFFFAWLYLQIGIFSFLKSLQTEYDKIQDEVELCKKSNKVLESDILKCSQEFSQSRETCANQKEEIDQLRNNCSQLQAQINTITNSNKELESRIIVLQSECKNEKKKNNDFQECENERNQVKQELALKNEEVGQLRERLDQSLQQISIFQQEIADKDLLLDQFKDLQSATLQLNEDNQKNFETVKSQEKIIEKCNQTIDELTTKNGQSEKQIDDLQWAHSQRVSALELIISELENKLQLSEEDLSLNKTKFDEYKQRVSSVLKENKLNNFEYSKNIEDLHFKIESLQEENNGLR